jgi:hypothetical protein
MTTLTLPDGTRLKQAPSLERFCCTGCYFFDRPFCRRPIRGSPYVACPINTAFIWVKDADPSTDESED